MFRESKVHIQKTVHLVVIFTFGAKCEYVSCVFAYCSVPCEEEPSAFSVGCQPCDTHQVVGGRKEGLEREGRRVSSKDRCSF